MRCVLLLRQCGLCTVSLLFRNIIKVDLASRAMSLQAPGLFSSARDVKYFNSSGGNTVLIRYPDIPQCWQLLCFHLVPASLIIQLRRVECS